MSSIPSSLELELNGLTSLVFGDDELVKSPDITPLERPTSSVPHTLGDPFLHTHEKTKTFSDLPTELLHAVSIHLADDDLMNLSQVSRQLHYIGIPLYLKRWGIQDALNLGTEGEIILFSYKRDNVLRGLQSALFLTSIKCLHCKFQFPELRTIWQVSNLRRLLQKVSRVEELVLDFFDLWQQLEAPFAGREMIGSSDWRQAFEEIIQTAVQQKGCIALTIRRGEFLWIDPGKTRRAAIHGVSEAGAIRRPFLAVKRSLSNLIGKPPAPQVNSLSNDLCEPRMAEILNSSAITHLSLDNMNLPASTWSQLLNSITLEALSELSINSARVAFSDLSPFLVRHPHITSLRLGKPDWPLYFEKQFPSTLLVQLHTLDAHPDYVAFFLAAPRALPHLSEITVWFVLSSSASFVAADRVLEPVAARVAQTELSLRLDIAAHDWINDIAAEGGESWSVLQRATRMELHCDRSVQFAARIHLAQWLALFKQLRHLTLVGFAWGTPREILFLRSLDRTTLRTVVIDGEMYAIAPEKYEGSS